MGLVKNYPFIWRQDSGIFIAGAIHAAFNVCKKKMMVHDKKICISSVLSDSHDKAFFSIRTTTTHAGITFTVDAVPYSIGGIEAEVAPAARLTGLGPVVYPPDHFIVILKKAGLINGISKAPETYIVLPSFHKDGLYLLPRNVLGGRNILFK